MKRLAFIFCAFVLFAFQPATKNIEGVWKLVAYKGVNNGVVTHTIHSEEEGKQLKTWTKAHFLFVGKYKINETWLNNYGCGTYTLDGNHYSENIDIHTGGAQYEGTTAKLLIYFSGDTLVQINPVNDDWTYDENNCRIEKYIRAE